MSRVPQTKFLQLDHYPFYETVLSHVWEDDEFEDRFKCYQKPSIFLRNIVDKEKVINGTVYCVFPIIVPEAMWSNIYNLVLGISSFANTFSSGFSGSDYWMYFRLYSV